jgi:Spy/CpxP family protein refolding chaperone
MKRIITLTGAAMGVLVLAGLGVQAALAAPGFHGRGPVGPMGGLAGPGAEFMFEALDLTPEQREAVNSLMETYRPRLKTLRDSGRETRRVLMNTTPDDPDYSTVVAQASQEAGENASAMVLVASELRTAVHGLLTVEQREKALELRSKMRERFRDRQERRRLRRDQSPDGA